MAGQFHVIPIFLILFAFLFALRAASFVKMVAGNDYAGNKFQDCCKKAEISCCEVCKYPPPDFTFWEQYCMLSYNAAFIACYTGGHNNTKCCSDRGVVGVYGICQDFCDGTTSHSWDMRYMVCGSVKKIISECNHDSIKPQPITEENRTWK